MNSVNPITRSAAWVRASSVRAKAREAVRPGGAPLAHAEGIPSDRVLLLGSGPAMGWGAHTWDDALAGQLARALAARTGRGVDVEVIADQDLTVHNAADAVDGVKLWRYAAIVVSLGFNETIDLAYPLVWAGQLEALLQRLSAAASRGAVVVVLGNPPSASLPHLSERFSEAVDAHAAELDAATAELARVFVPLRADGWAADIADALAPHLERARLDPARDPRLDEGYDSDDDRLRAVAALAESRWGAGDRLDEVLALARDLFGTESALFTVVDRDVEHHAAYLGASPDDVPRASSFCSVTIQQRGAMVIGDASRDARFASNPLVLGDPNVRFYAGFPIDAPGGEPIGALCVFDPAPRDPDSIDGALLRKLALLLQAEVHRATS